MAHFLPNAIQYYTLGRTQRRVSDSPLKRESEREGEVKKVKV